MCVVETDLVPRRDVAARLEAEDEADAQVEALERPAAPIRYSSITQPCPSFRARNSSRRPTRRPARSYASARTVGTPARKSIRDRAVKPRFHHRRRRRAGRLNGFVCRTKLRVVALAT
jgi:hypothetical protein